MKPFTILSSVAIALFVAGCTSQQQFDALRADDAVAERVYAATTQASATARAAVATMPTGSPAATQASDTLAKAEQVEEAARRTLDVARAAIDAAQQRSPADPALATEVATAVAAIPGPWSPVLASLIPAAIPLIYSLVQSSKLGRAHQQVIAVTEKLQQHQAALVAMQPAKAV